MDESGDKKKNLYKKRAYKYLKEYKEDGLERRQGYCKHKGNMKGSTERIIK